MTRDEFLSGDHDGETTCGEGRSVFIVSVASTHHTVETSLRAAVHDYFGSLSLGVRKLGKPGCDQVVARQAGSKSTTRADSPGSTNV